MLLVQVRFGFIDLKFNCRYSFRPEKKRRNCWFCWWSILLLLCVYQRQRHPDMEKCILTFVRGSGSVWVHLSTILRVQVWFRFTEVKFCWFRFGSGSPKWNGSFGFTVRVQVRFDTLIQVLFTPLITSHPRSLAKTVCSWLFTNHNNSRHHKCWTLWQWLKWKFCSHCYVPRNNIIGGHKSINR